MVEIDRMALVLRPRQPFIDWLKAIADDEHVTDQTLQTDPTVVLVPVIDNEEELGVYVAQNYRPWLEHEFGSWCLKEEDWPKDRDLQAFQKYFDLDIHSLVIDSIAEEYTDYENVTLQ